MPTKKRKVGGGSSAKSKKAKKQKSGKKRLDGIKKGRVKAATKSAIAAKLRVRNAKGWIGANLKQYEFLVDAEYTLFDDPTSDDTPTSGGFRGCQKMTVTLGPKQEFGEPGTNSTGQHPRAIAKACSTYGHPFKSGHVLNADFGGPNSNDNMTILTSSANSAQRTFDSNLKKARNALYDVYDNFAKCGPKEESFFKDLDYGIEVVIVIGASGGVWAKTYPGNCISNRITLKAKIINAANVTAAADDKSNFTNAIPSRLKDTARLLKNVKDLVDTANAGSPLDNSKY